MADFNNGTVNEFAFVNFFSVVGVQVYPLATPINLIGDPLEDLPRLYQTFCYPSNSCFIEGLEGKVQINYDVDTLANLQNYTVSVVDCEGTTELQSIGVANFIESLAAVSPNAGNHYWSFTPSFTNYEGCRFMLRDTATNEVKLVSSPFKVYPQSLKGKFFSVEYSEPVESLYFRNIYDDIAVQITNKIWIWGNLDGYEFAGDSDQYREVSTDITNSYSMNSDVDKKMSTRFLSMSDHMAMNTVCKHRVTLFNDKEYVVRGLAYEYDSSITSSLTDGEFSLIYNKYAQSDLSGC